VSAEGSFFIKCNLDACFQIKQRAHPLMFDAFKLVFMTNRKASIDLSGYEQFSVSSRKDVQTVIDFFSKQHPLLGSKLIHYKTWIVNLRTSSRYDNLKF